MPETHELPGRWFWHLQQYPDLAAWSIPEKLPRFTEPAKTYETEPPFRTGRGRAYRFWPTRWAVVVGRWAKHAYDHETVALERALGGRMMPTTLAEIKEWSSPTHRPGGPLPEGFEDTPGVVSWVEPEAKQ